MATEFKRMPFASLVDHRTTRLPINSALTEASGPPIYSIEENVQRLAAELQEPLLVKPLTDLLHDYRNNPAVKGVALVALYGRHLSIRPLTDFSNQDEEQLEARRAIGERYDVSAQALYATLSEPHSITLGLNSYDTRDRDAKALVPELLAEVRKQVDAKDLTDVSFVIF